MSIELIMRRGCPRKKKNKKRQLLLRIAYSRNFFGSMSKDVHWTPCIIPDKLVILVGHRISFQFSN